MWRPRRASAERPGQQQQRRGQPRRHEVEQVVQARRGLAQVLVAPVVADHRVERVDRAVRHRARHAEQREVEQRRRHAVAGVLGQRLDAGADELLGRQRARVAAAQAAQLIAGGVQIVRERGLHAPRRLTQPVERERRLEQQRAGGERRPRPRRERREQRVGGDEAQRRQQQRHARPPGELRARAVRRRHDLRGFDGAADPHHRMQAVGRLAEQAVDRQRAHEQQRAHRRISCSRRAVRVGWATAVVLAPL
jgi:hypothetical protein